jgi:hypothetical protein
LANPAKSATHSGGKFTTFFNQENFMDILPRMAGFRQNIENIFSTDLSLAHV